MGILGFSGLYTIGESVPVIIDDFKPVEGDSSDASVRLYTTGENDSSDAGVQSDSSEDFVRVVLKYQLMGGK
jgi:hypothetical protein